MKRILITLTLLTMIVSCEKEESKYLIEYRFINKSDYRKLIVGIDSYTYFPKENITICKGEAFKLTQPDTVAIVLNGQNNLSGYNGCKTYFDVDIEIYTDLGNDSVLYRSVHYKRDANDDISYRTINNDQDKISTFIWPNDTLVWIKTNDYTLKYKKDLKHCPTYNHKHWNSQKYQANQTNKVQID